MTSQRFDPGRPTLDPNGPDLASAWFVIVLCLAGLFVLIYTQPPLWAFLVGFVSCVVLLCAAVVYVCRRPEDTPEIIDQEPGYLP